MSESVREALATLPKTYREVLMLQYFGGMNSDEIAKALGTSPTAIRMRLSRARAQLKEEMVAIMTTAFEGQRLQAGFTFRIVESFFSAASLPSNPVFGSSHSTRPYVRALRDLTKNDYPII